MIKVNANRENYLKVKNVYANVEGTQKEIIKIWSNDANDWIYEATDYIESSFPTTYGEILTSTLPVTIKMIKNTPLLNYRIYGNTYDDNGSDIWVGERLEYEFVSYDKFELVNLGNDTYRYGMNLGVLPPNRTYTISWSSLETGVTLFLTILYTDGTRSSITLTNNYTFTADGTSTYLLRTNKSETTPSIDSLVSELSCKGYMYRINIVPSAKLMSQYYNYIYLDNYLRLNEYIDFKRQKMYLINDAEIPEDVFSRFQADNEITLSDPEPIVNNGNRIKTTSQVTLGSNYTCTEIGMIYSNNEDLCDNTELFLFNVDDNEIKKGSFTDGRVTRSANTSDNGYGVKVVGFATISDGTYSVTIYSRIIHANFYKLSASGEFNVYPPNEVQNLISIKPYFPFPTLKPLLTGTCYITIVKSSNTSMADPEKIYIKYKKG